MDVIELIRTNLLSPIFLAFVLGVSATLVRSDLKFPPGLYAGLSAYLMLAVGLKGGAELAKLPFSSLLAPLAATLALSILTPAVAFVVARKAFRFGKSDAAALSAHYGSVSAVTFIAATAFAEAAGAPAPGFMPALVAVLEVPAILIGIAIGKSRGQQSFSHSIRELVTSKSIFLLLGGLLIGAISAPQSLDQVRPLFGDLFRGALVIFMLDMGMIAAARFKDVGKQAARLIALGILLPIVNGTLGVLVGTQAGLGIGGSAVLGAMAASASYIAAPAAVRAALPDASPGVYLPAAIAITFPFNLSVGIPLLMEIARRLG